ncbi:CDP-diacylglycerol--glycerol-3-phosphate 3-phosphatidyltransferase [Candidatus Dependentiae bacterium]
MNKIFTIPNILTFFRIMFTPVFIFLFFQGEEYFFGSVFIFTVAAITDYCDGYLARALKAKSYLGSFLDPLADKFLIMSAFFIFYLLKIIDLWMMLIIFGRDIGITFLRIYLIKNGVSLQTSYLAKVKTTVQFIAIYLIFIYTYISYFIDDQNLIFITNNIVNIFMYFVIVMTLWSAIDYLSKNWSRITAYDKKG